MSLLRQQISRLRWVLVGAAVWLAVVGDWLTLRWLPEFVRGPVFALAAIAAGYALWRFRKAQPLILSGVFTAAWLPLWQCSVYLADLVDWAQARVTLASIGQAGLFLIGLAWVVWGVDRAAQRRRQPGQPDEGPARGKRVWDPLDLRAWYYGRRARKLNQSLGTLTAYALAFYVLGLLLSATRGCEEIYELPAGGGEQAQLAQTVQVQRVIRKKFVINPFSAIIFNPPPIDDVQLQLMEVTQHAYSVGYGGGSGPGFAGGTRQGKVRFIRLEYAGGDWDQDFGVGADVNMLVEYNIRTGQQVAERTESRGVAQLANFPLGKSPPLVYLTGQRSISLSKSEIRILREYLLDKHGMLFGDNGGSGHFHNQFLALMNEVLPEVEAVEVPLDDVIHRIPYPIPFLPFVAPHGGRIALGWKYEGRWVCYYHPGDIGDAWSDDHSGVSRDIWEACYQLGTNVIFYAHTEYAKWLQARAQE